MNQTQLIWIVAILYLPLIPLKIIAHYRRKKHVASDEYLLKTIGVTRLEAEELNRKYGGS